MERKLKTRGGGGERKRKGEEKERRWSRVTGRERGMNKKGKRCYNGGEGRQRREKEREGVE
jgi:hypothetical protein